MGGKNHTLAAECSTKAEVQKLLTFLPSENLFQCVCTRVSRCLLSTPSMEILGWFICWQGWICWTVQSVWFCFHLPFIHHLSGTYLGQLWLFSPNSLRHSNIINGIGALHYVNGPLWKIQVKIYTLITFVFVSALSVITVTPNFGYYELLHTCRALTLWGGLYLFNILPLCLSVCL